MNTITYIKNEFYDALEECFNLSPDQLKNVELKLNFTPGHGDLTTNAAMVLSKTIGQSPNEIAQKIVDLLTHTEFNEHENLVAEHIADVKIMGPGFVNIWLKEQAWHSTAHEMAVHGPKCFKPDILLVDKKKFLIEFVSANPTGPLSLAHGRNAIVGDVLARVLQFLGHKVIREFYINDAGQQIAELGKSLLAKLYQANGHVFDQEVQYPGAYMAEVAQAFINIHKFSDLSDVSIEELGSFAQSFLLEKIKTDLQAYDISFDNWFSEKTLYQNNAVQDAIAKLKAANFCYEQDGALWFKSTEFGDDKDRVLQKSDGSYTYVAPDVAYHQYKFAQDIDVIINIFGQDHHSYAKRLEGLMQALGYDASKLKFIIYQLVRMKQGDALVRMSKRSGAFISLRDVIDTIGKDAARFFYLNKKIDAHLELDLDMALKKDTDNPVYYIQYAFVRINSILAKAKDMPEFSEYVTLLLEERMNEVEVVKSEREFGEEETNLLKKVCWLEDILQTIANTYQTHLLAIYTHELASTFHSYYNASKIIDPAHPDITKSRLLLIDVVHQCLDVCLTLLGLSKPEKM